jgi:hypothetical protein
MRKSSTPGSTGYLVGQRQPKATSQRLKQLIRELTIFEMCIPRQFAAKLLTIYLSTTPLGNLPMPPLDSLSKRRILAIEKQSSSIGPQGLPEYVTRQEAHQTTSIAAETLVATLHRGGARAVMTPAHTFAINCSANKSLPTIRQTGPLPPNSAPGQTHLAKTDLR